MSRKHVVCAALSLAIAASNVSAGQQTPTLDRQPAVAGQFYPADAGELRSTLKDLFAHAVAPKGLENVVAIIVPHAGYVFSGSVAASSYSQIDPKRRFENIFVLGPSHYVGFDGASVYVDGRYVTPLGPLDVNTKLGRQLIEKNKVFVARRDAHLQEHSVEVQLPFLQYRFGEDCRIVPIVFGVSSPSTCKEIAEALRPYFNEKNLFVISSDFSHYPAYDDAQKADHVTAEAILTRSPDNFINAIGSNESKRMPNLVTSACGWPCILTLLYLVENDPRVSVQLIQYKNSGDAAVGQKDRVVGYCAFAVTLRQAGKKESFNLDDRDKKELLLIARKTVEQHAKEGRASPLDPSTMSKALLTNCGAFVTLKKNGDLRGCIGRFDATEPLYKVVQEMAIESSTQDYRFSPVSSREVNQLEIEISVLTPMRRIKSIDEIEMGKHGIYIRKGMQAGTFLPQVATETGWSKVEFLGHCAEEKAGIGWNGWRDAEIYVYEALVFSEKDLKMR